ncbi:MAG: helix-turn-helix transcriptional regulator [Planctomycetota bacterium]
MWYRYRRAYCCCPALWRPSPYFGVVDDEGVFVSYYKLTPSEITVANLIKHGRTTKEVSEYLGLSRRTVEVHRYNIRNKFEIKNKKVNLRSYLLSIV